MLRKIAFETTMRCDLRCAHCVQGYPEQRFDLPLDVAARVLEEAKPFGAKHVVLSGGEPHLHPEFNRLVEMVHEAGYTWSFISHGGRAEPYAQLMDRFRSSCSYVTLSIDGAKAATHDAIRRSPGAFERVLISARHYIKLGFRVTMQTSINKMNMSELESIVWLVEDIGAVLLAFTGTIPTPGNTKLQLTDEERFAVYERIQAIRRAADIEIRYSSALYTPGGVHFCPRLSLDSLTFNPRGELIFCCNLQSYGQLGVIGSAVDTSLSDLITGWIEQATQLKHHRIKCIAAGDFGMIGHDTCAFCNRYFSNGDHST